MSDLYDRIDEIQGMVRILTSDVDYLRPKLGERSIQVQLSEAEEANRRFYVRAIFSLIEAVVEQHKRLLLDLAKRNIIILTSSVIGALSERAYVVNQNGTVGERKQYLQLKRKLRAVYRAAGEAFNQPLDTDFGDQGWQAFCEALDIRDRLTHPKTFDDCHVDEEALNTVDSGHTWFRNLNNEFVKVARKHRENNSWENTQSVDTRQ
jgi:hypothetical protein